MKKTTARDVSGRSRTSLCFAALEHPCSSEGRYKSQALLGEAAVLTCMAYVDLNPIRADIAATPETSDYTSVKQRIDTFKKKKTNEHAPKVTAKPKNIKNTEVSLRTSVKLMPLVKQKNDRHPNAIGYTLKDYLELIDWVGCSVRNDKRGAIASSNPPILQ